LSPVNDLGQPIGEPVPGWAPRPSPGRTSLHGRFCRLEPLQAARHAEGLHEANRADTQARMWTYLSYGPFTAIEEYWNWVEQAAASEDPLFQAVIDQRTDAPAGVAAFLRIEPAVGVIEVGHIAFAPALQRTPAASEAMYLLMRRVFDELGYRRYEWKCDALNSASRSAAERLGFRFEGVFRQATIYKGRNRDTAWYSITDQEWPARKQAFEAWLDPANFDAHGRQKTRLGR
jgi:RimJ/RimL family protein N-acetyltransferase